MFPSIPLWPRTSSSSSSSSCSASSARRRRLGALSCYAYANNPFTACGLRRSAGGLEGCSGGLPRPANTGGGGIFHGLFCWEEGLARYKATAAASAFAVIDILSGEPIREPAKMELFPQGCWFLLFVFHAKSERVERRPYHYSLSLSPSPRVIRKSRQREKKANNHQAAIEIVLHCNSTLLQQQYTAFTQEEIALSFLSFQSASSKSPPRVQKRANI